MKNKLGQHSPVDIPIYFIFKDSFKHFAWGKKSVSILGLIFGTCYLRAFETELLLLLFLSSICQSQNSIFSLSQPFLGKHSNR